jgi:uncharacterized protein (TIGR02301 family)
MAKRFHLSLFAVLCLTGMPVGNAVAQPADTAPAETKAAPYDDRLLRLAEIVGAVHYLRTLCTAADTANWRKSMNDLLDAETINEPARRQKLTAAFNRGYRSFAAIHTSCTPAAIVAEENYRNEGATLAGEIASRFGN